MTRLRADGYSVGGGNPAVDPMESIMSFGDLCLVLGALFGFRTLLLKVVEVARRR
jgi:hypothetical protein